MEKLLIYIGANRGFGLTGLLNRKTFDRVIAFEPDAEMYNQLVKNIQHGLLSKFKSSTVFQSVNAACYTDNEIKDLFVFDNRVSTSLGDAFYDYDKKKVIKSIKVEVFNLFDFLKLNNIEYIDYLLTDCQGADYLILKSIESFIENKKIGTIYCETHHDDYHPYVGLSNNFSLFKKLLNTNYKVDYFSCDGIIKKSTDKITDTEWDTCWKKR